MYILTISLSYSACFKVNKLRIGVKMTNHVDVFRSICCASTCQPVSISKSLLVDEFACQRFCISIE